ncbi:MAG TPA: TIGR03435 family protein [Acidobacteriaceae bacterium]
MQTKWRGAGGTGWRLKSVFVVAASLWMGMAARAQDTAKPEPPKMMAKDVDPDWEVVTVKPDDPNSTETGFWIHDRGVEIKGKTAEQLLLYGYGLHQSQALNAPGWMRTERWHVEGIAGVPGQPNREQMGSLVRKLLAERFGLVMHQEQREMRVFALTAAKGGPKMAASADGANAPMHENDSQSGGQATMRVKNISTGELAGTLMRLFLDRPVVDRTGLTQRYDFLLKWTQDETHVPMDGSAPPGLFTAIQEQLGLKLEPTKAMADVMVIDKVEPPGAN